MTRRSIQDMKQTRTKFWADFEAFDLSSACELWRMKDDESWIRVLIHCLTAILTGTNEEPFTVWTWHLTENVILLTFPNVCIMLAPFAFISCPDDGKLKIMNSNQGQTLNWADFRECSVMQIFSSKPGTRRCLMFLYSSSLIFALSQDLSWAICANRLRHSLDSCE